MTLNHTDLFNRLVTENNGVNELKLDLLNGKFEGAKENLQLYQSHYREMVDFLRELQESQVGVIARRVEYEGQEQWWRDATNVQDLSPQRMPPDHPRILVNETVLRALRLVRSIDFAIEKKYRNEENEAVIARIKAERQKLFSNVAVHARNAFDAIQFTSEEQKKLDKLNKKIQGLNERKAALDGTKATKINDIKAIYEKKKLKLNTIKKDKARSKKSAVLDKKQQKAINKAERYCVKKHKQLDKQIKKAQKKAQETAQKIYQKKARKLKKIETTFNDHLIKTLNFVGLAKGCETQEDASKLLIHYRDLGTSLDPAIPMVTISKVYSNNHGIMYCYDRSYPVTKKNPTQQKALDKIQGISLYPTKEDKNFHSVQNLAIQEANLLFLEEMREDDRHLGAQARKMLLVGSKHAYVCNKELYWQSGVNLDPELIASQIMARMGSPVYVGKGEVKKSIIIQARANIEQVLEKINELADKKKAVGLVCLNSRSPKDNEMSIVDWGEEAINQINMARPDVDESFLQTVSWEANARKCTVQYQDKTYDYDITSIENRLGSDDAKRLLRLLKSSPVNPSETMEKIQLLLRLLPDDVSNLHRFYHIPVNFIGRIHATKGVGGISGGQKKYLKVTKLDRAETTLKTINEIVTDFEGGVVPIIQCASGQDRTGTAFEAYTIHWTAEQIFDHQVKNFLEFKEFFEQKYRIKLSDNTDELLPGYQTLYDRAKQEKVAQLIKEINDKRAAAGNLVYLNSHSDGGGFSGCKKVSDLGILTHSEEIYRNNAEGNKCSPVSKQAIKFLKAQSLNEDANYRAQLKKFIDQIKALQNINPQLADKFQAVKEHIEQLRGANTKKMPFELPIILEQNIKLLQEFNGLAKLESDKSMKKKQQSIGSIQRKVNNIKSIAKKIEGKPTPIYKVLGAALAVAAGAILIGVGIIFQFPTIIPSHGVTFLGIGLFSAGASLSAAFFQEGKRKKLSASLEAGTNEVADEVNKLSSPR